MNRRPDPVEAARAEYRRLRANCKRYDAKAFDAIVCEEVCELRDGDDERPNHEIYLVVARMVARACAA